ncbi:argininosuccinate lyase [Balneolaceae bacterium YR4-1]|uniref:Argininosuccinate lyase n=1 Tax=Halalkalibaculum roseum TaxID=2709311 RepID=A0A6M1T2U0_9BACT|nr:argininosuccinate lyase [Halalkalibaculum roseum]NGP77087.1 argininosuccinate lyase [Halalkalibaculum roseum]
MKLWDKGQSVDELVESFTVGNDRELDLRLAIYDLKASKAHAEMLNAISILSDDECAKLLTELDNLLHDLENGEFVIESDFEDIHSKIEFELTDKLGDTGKKIHTGRSRNDQVLVCMHLYMKDEITEIKGLIKDLFDLLILRSGENSDTIMPGYTHMQAAMPSSFGLWFGAYAETLIDDLFLLNAAYRIADQNPLGSAAGFGTSLPINRSMTTELLGFKTLKYNVVAAQMSRGRLEQQMASAIASVAATLSKMAGDVCLYISQEFNFVSLPDELTTGSSIMPHKKNPDVFELIRARCNRIQALPNQITMVTGNLNSGYHRDFQELKELLFPAIDKIKDCLYMMHFMVKNLKINKNIMDDTRYRFIFSVEEVNNKVRNSIPFREAYKEVARNISNGSFQPSRKINHTHEGSIGNLCLDQIKSKFYSAYRI